MTSAQFERLKAEADRAWIGYRVDWGPIRREERAQTAAAAYEGGIRLARLALEASGLEQVRLQAADVMGFSILAEQTTGAARVMHRAQTYGMGYGLAVMIRGIG